jgi:hypothetical protein
MSRRASRQKSSFFIPFTFFTDIRVAAPLSPLLLLSMQHRWLYVTPEAGLVPSSPTLPTRVWRRIHK